MTARRCGLSPTYFIQDAEAGNFGYLPFILFL